MNWPELIKFLQTHGMSQVEIGARCGVSQGHIGDLLSGRNRKPSFDLGMALIALRNEKRANEEEAA